MAAFEHQTDSAVTVNESGFRVSETCRYPRILLHVPASFRQTAKWQDGRKSLILLAKTGAARQD